MATACFPYVIDYQVVSKGKTLGASKKRIIFKFGFANAQALSDGLVGANCRGSEHEVNLIWSLNTGKRQILADGKEVHYSESRANGWTADRSFQHSFTLRSPGYGAFKCRVVSVPAQPGVLPYDLIVGGVSIHRMCKIFQLGTSQMREMSRVIGGDGGPHHDPDIDPYASPEERRAIAQAKLESLRDVRQHRTSAPPATAAAAPPPVREEASLISFDDDPAPPAVAVGGMPDRGVSALTMDPSLTHSPPAGPYGAPPPPGGQYPPQQQQMSSSALTPWQPPAGGAGAAAPGYAQAPPPVPQQQPWGAQPAYGSAAAPAPAYGTAPAPAYGAAAAPSVYGGAPPQQQQPAVNPYGAPAPAPGFVSPGGSVGTYGSAPAFAQPPPAAAPAAAPAYPQYTGY